MNQVNQLSLYVSKTVTSMNYFVRHRTHGRHNDKGGSQWVRP